MTIPTDRPLKFLRYPETMLKTGLRKSRLHEMIKAKQFVRPVSLGGRAVGFVETEVEDWMRQRMEARHG